MQEDYDVFCMGRQFAEEAVARTIPYRGLGMRKTHEELARRYMRRHLEARVWRVVDAYGPDAKSVFCAGAEDHLLLAVNSVPADRYR